MGTEVFGLIDDRERQQARDMGWTEDDLISATTDVTV